jgi:translation initiation factor IF-3
VRLVGPSGEQVGIVSITDALRLAQEADLDLVEVAPTARPPVCKLMDYGKFKYESALKARESRKNQAQTVIKEIKIRPKIDPHDYGTKKGHVERFLKQGDKVKVTIMFRGREQSRPELGYKLLQRLAGDVEELGFVESAPKQDGRNMIMVIGPHRKKADAKPTRAPDRASARASAPNAQAVRDDDDFELALAARPQSRPAPQFTAGSADAATAEVAEVTGGLASASPVAPPPAEAAVTARSAPAAPRASHAPAGGSRPAAPRPGPAAVGAARPAAPRPGATAASTARPTGPRPGPADTGGPRPAAPRPGPSGVTPRPGPGVGGPRPTAPKPGPGTAGGPRPAAPKPSAPRPAARPAEDNAASANAASGNASAGGTASGGPEAGSAAASNAAPPRPRSADGGAPAGGAASNSGAADGEAGG